MARRFLRVIEYKSSLHCWFRVPNFVPVAMRQCREFLRVFGMCFRNELKQVFCRAIQGETQSLVCAPSTADQSPCRPVFTAWKKRKIKRGLKPAPCLCSCQVDLASTKHTSRPRRSCFWCLDEWVLAKPHLTQTPARLVSDSLLLKLGLVSGFCVPYPVGFELSHRHRNCSKPVRTRLF